jgi:hypothetical protein
MALWDNGQKAKQDYRAGLNNQRTTFTDIHGLDYRKGVLDRQQRENNPLFGPPKQSIFGPKKSWF